MSKARNRLAEMRANRERYDASLEIFAGDALVIRPKSGGDQLLRFNQVQKDIDIALDNQLNETGRVRALVLKARQVGISTYLGARNYHRVTRKRGTRALVMTHRDRATANLFNMIKRFADNDPHAPRVHRSNEEELSFADLDSGISIATAGASNTGGGRSFTFQFAHLSEVAYWKAASEHALGILETVPDEPGTEIIQESTANGMSNFWHAQCMAAMKGTSQYQLIFIPYYRHEEYQREPPAGWVPPEAFREMGDAHNLTAGQVYWAWQKNRSIAAQSNDDPDEICWRFRQEYPTTIEEAFRASRRGGFIKSSVVVRAIGLNLPNQLDPLVLGCDFATGGGGDPNEDTVGEDGQAGDANVFISRRGRVAGRELFKRFHDRDTVSVADKLAAEINRLKPVAVFMDIGGGGAAVHDILARRGYTGLILVNFGAKAADGRKYRNKRAEIYGRLRDWLAQEGGADIPAEDALEAELTTVQVHNEDNGLLLMPKKIFRSKFGFSPDGSDALGTTFASPIPNQPGRRITVSGTEVVSAIGGY